MRNLSLFATTTTELPSAKVSATAVDLDEHYIYATSEHLSTDGEVKIELWKTPQDAGGPLVMSGSPEMISMFTSIAASGGPPSSQIISLRVISELRRISVIMRGGDIVMVSLDEEMPHVEVEGTVDSGISAAAWSPDETLLALVTGEEKLILMTSTFEVISEAPLETVDFGEDAPINVGWGSKQTQFHGSLGKTAAQAPNVVKIGSSPDDDNLPRISWRGDGALFVVSSLSSGTSLRPRTLRVYDRQAALQSTSEAVPGLEHALVWRPSGNLIVGTQRFGFEGGGAGREGRHDVVFFERNGLRHGEFSLRVDFLSVKPETDVSDRRWGYRIRELRWSSDSNILAVWIEREEGDIVQLWTTGNYHWYLKHEVPAPSSDGKSGHFTSVEWHPELTSHLILTTESEIIQRTYTWDTFVSLSQPPRDSGTVAVLDGSNVLLTPFRTQNVPPPMSSYQLTLSLSHPHLPFQTLTPIHISFSENDSIAILWEFGYVEVWDLHTRLGPGQGKVMEPSKSWSGLVNEGERGLWRQITIRQDDSKVSQVLSVLGTVNTSEVCILIDLEGGVKVKEYQLQVEPRNCHLVEGQISRVLQSQTGEIFTCTDGSEKVALAKFPSFCFQARGLHLPSVTRPGELSVYAGLGSSGKLFLADGEAEALIVATNATSFTVASGFLIFTTSGHEAIFAPFGSLSTWVETRNYPREEAPTTEWASRKLERGSKIVVAVPSAMSLVLQMPRGNLETINPRPLVMEVVNRDLQMGDYRKAFFACRKHRIDINVLVDHDEVKFLERITSFVEQIHEVDHLNVFLTLLGRGTRNSQTIANICDAIRLELEKKDLTKYINTILTAHVVKSPPNYEAGLALLLHLKESDPVIVEDAVKYIIFLVDADSLFDTALGMYDFALVLMIAQHAQKDPREYLPFLRELRSLDKYYQRFRIDDHLKRYERALHNLSLAGPERFEEAIAYIERHALYEKALSIWSGTEQHSAVLEIYGDWLFERREFRQAASVFMEASKTSKAMIAYEKDLAWQELFDLALCTGVQADKVVAMGYRVAEDLSSKKRHAEASRVLLDYSGDVREAVITLVQGNGFSEARRIASLNIKPELLEDVIHPAASESCAQISDDIKEMTDQLRKQLNRIRELRIRKIEQPDAFYEVEDVALHNVDVMTDISMAPTAFTRYTAAPTNTSRTSKRSSRSKRKSERKVGSGRKGTIDEEEYLLKSISKLAERFKVLGDEARNLLPHLSQFSDEHRDEGIALQKEISAFETEFNRALDEIWSNCQDEADSAPPADSFASRMEELEKNKQIDPAKKVQKPELPSSKHWQFSLFNR